MVAPKGNYHAEVQESIGRNMNLRFLFYKPQDHHLELRDSIHELSRLVDVHREDLARTRDW